MKTHLKIIKEHLKFSSENRHLCTDKDEKHYNGDYKYIGPIPLVYYTTFPRLRSLLMRDALINEQGRVFGENRVFWRGQVIGHENYRFKTLSLNRKIVDIYKEIEQQK